MIYTVTLNPAIDYVVGLDTMNLGAVNRCCRETIEFGGKGINVSRVLHSLGIETTALGFVAGFTGQALEQGLQKMGLTTRFIPVSEGMTRINVKIHAGQETQINGMGPQIGAKDLDRLKAQLAEITEGNTVVFSGSVPKCLGSNIYVQLMECLRSGVRTVVDTTGEALRAAMSRRPYLVKPNLEELEEFFGVSMDSKENIVSAARQMQKMGAKNVLISMAAAGAVLLDECGQVHWSAAPSGEVINSVGAGDSMVAGFLASVTEGENYGLALRMGIAAGSATAFQTGLAKKTEILELLAGMETDKREILPKT